MKLPHNAHVALVDGEHFTLFRNDGQAFEPKLSQQDKPDLDPTNFSAGVKHQDDVGQRHGRTQLDELAHGAAAAEWLNARAIDGSFDQIAIIADPKTLGEMRQHYHGELEKKLVGEISKTLTGAPVSQIERAIMDA